MRAIIGKHLVLPRSPHDIHNTQNAGEQGAAETNADSDTNLRALRETMRLVRCVAGLVRLRPGCGLGRGLCDGL